MEAVTTARITLVLCGLQHGAPEPRPGLQSARPQSSACGRAQRSRSGGSARVDCRRGTDGSRRSQANVPAITRRAITGSCAGSAPATVSRARGIPADILPLPASAARPSHRPAVLRAPAPTGRRSRSPPPAVMGIRRLTGRGMRLMWTRWVARLLKDANGHGFITTLMQPSFLSRKVLYSSGPSSRDARWVMTKDGSISPFWIRSRSCGR